jgi:hypothetical protein
LSIYRDVLDIIRSAVDTSPASGDPPTEAALNRMDAQGDKVEASYHRLMGNLSYKEARRRPRYRHAAPAAPVSRPPLRLLVSTQQRSHAVFPCCPASFHLKNRCTP